jgi:hypothetical protein
MNRESKLSVDELFKTMPAFLLEHLRVLIAPENGDRMLAIVQVLGGYF